MDSNGLIAEFSKSSSLNAFLFPSQEGFSKLPVSHPFILTLYNRSIFTIYIPHEIFCKFFDQLTQKNILKWHDTNIMRPLRSPLQVHLLRR